MTSEILPKIQEICNLACGQRSAEDIKILSDYTEEIKLFKDLKNKQANGLPLQILQYLTYEIFNPNQYIFKCGETGNKFYILLSGLVGIEIPINDFGKLSYLEVMTYTPGSSFGELALETSKPRSASALAKTICHLLVLFKKDYLRFMQRIVSEKKNEIINFLQTLPLFMKINKLSLSKLIYNIKEKTYYKAQYIFREGEEAKEIFIIHDGECKICKKIIKSGSSSGIRKTFRQVSHTAKRLGRGAMMGEDDVLNKSSHSYSCICSSDSITVYTIPAADFFVRITAEQSLQYLRAASKEKSKFLESWASVRNSLDSIFSQKIEKNTQIKENNTFKHSNLALSCTREKREIFSNNKSQHRLDLAHYKIGSQEGIGFPKKKTLSVDKFPLKNLKSKETSPMITKPTHKRKSTFF
jgi:CRP-like cAMP-binding protein